MKKVTMSQIAQELGISRSLVSYALHGSYGVSETMRRTIVNKAVEMGYYKTSHSTIKLSKSILIIIDEGFLAKKSFFERIVSGIEYHAISKHFNPKIIEMESTKSLDHWLSEIVELRPQGCIVIREIDKALEKKFAQLNFPLVFVDLIAPTSSSYEVRVNNFSNMYDMVTTLIGKGHRDFCFVGDISWALSFMERYNGFVYACKENGVRYEAITQPSGIDLCFDAAAFAEYAKTHNDAVIVCANDSIAVEVYKILNRLGKKIPQDFGVAGFDDDSATEGLNPPLTTMHIPRFELGRVAFELLYEQIGGVASQSRVVCLNAELIDRESVLDKSNRESSEKEQK